MRVVVARRASNIAALSARLTESRLWSLYEFSVIPYGGEQSVDTP